MALDQGEAKNKTASEKSSVVVTLLRGVILFIYSKTSSGVSLLASVIFNNPPEIIFTVILNCPKSIAAVLVIDSNPPFAAV